MNWKSFDQFVQMGGYGLYVWGSYAVTLAVMLVETWGVRHRRRQALASARSEAAMEGAR
jgi:heme exporter protein D